MPCRSNADEAASPAGPAPMTIASIEAPTYTSEEYLD
jgi:hypothetical protein